MNAQASPETTGLTRMVWAVVALLAIVSIALWWRFGPGMFVDMIVSGWRMCF